MASDPNQIIMMVLQSLGRQTPTLIVFAIMFVVALIKWSQHPRASTLTVLAVVLAFGTHVVSAVAYPLLPRFIESMDLTWIYFGLTTFFSVLYGLSWLLLLGAIYSGRQADLPKDSPYGNKPQPPQAGTSPFQ